MDPRAEIIEKAMAAINAGDHAAALDLLERAIADAPADPGLNFIKSEALRVAGRLAEAEELLLALHHGSPGSADVLFRLGVTRLYRDNLPGAAEALDIAAKLDSTRPDIFAHLGQVQFRLGRLDLAAAAFRRAADLDPGAPSSALALAFCLSRQAASDPALMAEEDQLAETLGEGIADSVLHRYIALGLYEPIAWLTRAMMEAAPARAYWPTMRAAALNMLNRPAEAEAPARRSVELEPDNATAVLHLGTALRQSGQREEAENTLKRAVELAPDSADASMALATLYLDWSRFGDAARIAREFDQRAGLVSPVKRSVVIAVLDYSPGSPFNIRTLLDDLTEFDGEVICVFNGDQVFHDLRDHPRIDKYSFNKFNVGVSRGWNIGINQAEGETIHILNADLRISVEMLYRLEHWLHTLPDALCVGATAHWMDFGTMGETRSLNAGTFSEPVEADAVSGQLMSLHTARLHDAGITFDPRLAPYFGEETDLALKAKRAGYKIYAVPETDFEHPWGISRVDRPIFLFGRQVHRTRCMVNNKILLRDKIDTYLRDHPVRRDGDS